MSRFFRSASSSSSADSDSAEDSDKEINTVAKQSHSSTGASNSNASAKGREAHLSEISQDGQTTQHELAARPRRIAENFQATATSSAKGKTDHRDVLLHALLEDRCVNEVLASYSRGGLVPTPERDSPEIQARATARYQSICRQLASLNLISSGLEADQHARTRQRYRNGLDILSQQQATTAPPRLRRLLTDSDASFDASGPIENQSTDVLRGDSVYDRPPLPYQLRRLLTGPEVVEQQEFNNFIHHQNDNTLARTGFGTNPTMQKYGLPAPRYVQEFEELGTLGRGGYGIVYHVRHRLDNQSYAIKKVPLSATRLQRIQEKGQSELDEVLKELRTLARLDHPNIVRYHTGWIEWVGNRSSARSIRSRGEDTSLGAAANIELDRAVTMSEVEELNVVFEKSERTRHPQSGALSTSTSPPDLMALRPNTHGRLTEMRSLESSNFQNLAESDTYDTTSTISSLRSSTVESLARHESGIQSGSDGAYFKKPILAIHMQMSLHPMSLADFLRPSTDASKDNVAPPLSHCYHLEPSVSILLAILNGIEYLHSEGIAHRDIKPGNIFIGTKSHSQFLQGSVDLMQCNDCRIQQNATPIRLEIRIGDFGLVTFANEESQKSKIAAAGTQTYQPPWATLPKVDRNHTALKGTATTPLSAEEREDVMQPLNEDDPSLDIYALGIVAFELLWEFHTRMERLDAIQRLKQGELPRGFVERLGTHGKRVAECIMAMLSQNGISIVEVKKVFLDLQTTFRESDRVFNMAASP